MARSALILVDGGEALLERRFEIAGQARLAERSPAVQQDQPGFSTLSPRTVTD